jgi:tetraacyldisaccharide 4'-kinase
MKRYVAVKDRSRGWVSRYWRGELQGSGSTPSVVFGTAEVLYGVVVRVRNGLYDRGVLRVRNAGVPVVSVGNLTVGGTGKTPISSWLASRLAQLGGRPAIVVRGYGRDEIEVHRALNPVVPVFVARRRTEGARAAAAAGADCIVLDDGFQHRALRRTVDLVLIAADSWTETRRLLPRGPWREPLTSLRRADFVLLTRKAVSRRRTEAIVDVLKDAGVAAPIGTAHLRNTRLVPLHEGAPPTELGALAGRRVVAITSLADPRPFLSSLECAGIDARPLTFPDHHEFTREDILDIRQEAGAHVLVMTLKEAVKLRNRLPGGAEGYFAEQEVVLESGEVELDAMLRRTLAGPG